MVASGTSPRGRGAYRTPRDMMAFRPRDVAALHIWGARSPGTTDGRWRAIPGPVLMDALLGDPDVVAIERPLSPPLDLSFVANRVERQMAGRLWPAPVTSGGPALSVIVPARAASVHLPRLLGSLRVSTLPRNDWELIVVDDGSRDETSEVALTEADLLVRLRGNGFGPAYARNRGASLARGDILVFLDADVTVSPTALADLRRILDDEPSLAAVTGVYGDGSNASSLTMQYRATLDHVQQVACAGDVETFFAACGAIRRAAFEAVGGFDEWRFRFPGIEDIELGHRLLAAGYRIRLVPSIEVAHHKQWSFATLLRDEFGSRTLPGARAMGGRWRFSRSPSLAAGPRQAVLVALSGAAVVAVPMAFMRSIPWVAPLGILTAALLVDLPTLRRFAAAIGFAGVVRLVPMHLAVTLTNGLAFLAGRFLGWMLGQSRPSAIHEAWAEVGLTAWPPVPRGLDS